MISGEGPALRYSRRDRQWVGIFVKNWTLFLHNFGGFLSVVILTLILMVCTILLHNYYMENASAPPSSDDESSNTSDVVVGNWITNPYPSISSGNVLNVYYLGSPKLGTLPYTKIESTGYLHALDMDFIDSSNGLFFRLEYNLAVLMRKWPNETIFPEDSINCWRVTPRLPFYINFDKFYDGYKYMYFLGYDMLFDEVPLELQQPGVPDVVKLSYHAKRSSEAFRDAVLNSSAANIRYNEALAAVRVQEIPTVGIRYSQSFDSLPIQIVQEPDGDTLVVDFSYDLFTYSKRQVFYFDHSDHDRLLQMQMLQFHLCVRNIMKQIYDIQTTSYSTKAPEKGPLIIGKNAPFWRRSTGDFLGPDGLTPLILGLLVPFLMFIISPLITFSLVEEKASGILHLHSMMGQRYLARWLADFVFYFILTLSVAVLIVIFCCVGDLNGIRMNTPVVWIPMFLLFSMNVIVFSLFIAAFFENSRIAALVSIIIAFAYSIGGFLCVAKYASATTIDRSLSPLWSLIPFFGPISIHSQLQSLAILQTDSLYLRATDLRFYVHNPLLSRAYVGYSVLISLIITVIMTALMGLLSMYIDQIMPKTNGIASHWLFFLLPVVNRVDKIRGYRTKHVTTSSILKAVGWAVVHPERMCCSKNRNQHVSLIDSTDFHCTSPNTSQHMSALADGKELQNNVNRIDSRSSQQAADAAVNTMSIEHLKANKNATNMAKAPNSRPLDPDVLEERIRAKTSEKGFNDRQVLIRAIDLTKIYPGTRTTPEKHAVRGVSFTVAEGECLGLLGPNGAAKTTTINILTMLHRATTGEAYVLDKNLLDPYNKSYIQSITGICPQFDRLYLTLTCRQHLKYFCRMKSVAREDENRHIDELLESVGLTEKANSMTKSLSGGQKRRLSVAIALTGSPSVLYLDEPSTGLDPCSKRLLWNIILKIRTHKAILLTTHSMDEAQALCNRIAIMDRGTLKCIGKCNYLQAKYGGTLQIKVEIAKSNALDVGNVVNDVSLKHELEEAGHRLIEEAFGNSVHLRSNVAGLLTYDVSDKLTAPHAFAEMAKLARSHKKIISDWSLLQASLDRVFFNVILAS